MVRIVFRCMNAALLLLIILSPAGAKPMNFYVSPNGNDSWSGRLASPNRTRTDGPFATLERARDAIRALKKQGGLPDSGVTVWLRGGTYTQLTPFELTAEDSGTPQSPITYSAYRNEQVRLVGGKRVTGWQPVKDDAVLRRLPPAARGKVLVADLRAQGITDFGQMLRRGFGSSAAVPAGLELFYNGKPMPLARYPNEGWLKIATTPAGQQGGCFTCDDPRLRRWTEAKDVWVHGYWTWDWADSYERVVSIDAEKGEIVTAEPHGVYGYTPGKRFRVLNLLEELDAPGEWWLDRENALLYFYPPDDGASEAMVSLTEKPLMTLNGVSHLRIERMTFEVCRATGIEMRGGQQNTIAGCTFRNIGTVGVVIEGGTEHKVVSCDFMDLGDGGIQVSGGDRNTLTPCQHEVLNCLFTRYSRWSRTYRPAVLVNGVGVRVAHCLMYDAPHNAILFGGNDHLFEYNEVHHVCTETGDAGAFYIGRDFTQRGTVIRYNYFHDLGKSLQAETFVDVMAVYLDDCASGITIFGNVFYKAGRAAMIGGGRDNTVENNIFVECEPSVHVDARGLGWASFWFDGRDSTLMDRLKAVPYQLPPWSERYPELVNILNDEPAVPKGNRIIRNISVGGRWIDLYDNLTDKIVTIRDNIVDGDAGVEVTAKGIRLRKDSPAFKLGFQSIPLEKIGLYRDAYRKRLPSH
ncbi:MAG: right-handed parallel beta-helix repeat-containing protein [Firmicutes bacterium]|nr:right-handed parallel beta-helix repeat-containing protein [Bacillota bacterium]